MSSRKNHLFRLVLAAMFLALALVLPFLTGQIPQIGKALLPMHIPALLCGFFCGPWYALAVGAVAPLLRFALFSMPKLADAFPMCFELAAYGLAAGLLHRALPKKPGYVYVSLLVAMLAGRIVWGTVRVILFGLGKSSFGWQAFFAGAFLNAIPGILLQILLIPVLVIALEKSFPNLTKE